MFADPTLTVPEGVGTFHRERTLGLFCFTVLEPLPKCVLGASWGGDGASSHCACLL